MNPTPRYQLRILFPFVGDSVGGSHLSTLLLINGLSRERFTPIIALHRKGPLGDHLIGRNMSFTYMEGVEPVESRGLLGLCTSILIRTPRLMRFMRENEVDIVHTNDIRMHLTWTLATRLGGRKHVWHQRSADDSRRLSIFSKLASAVLTISRHCKNSLNAGIGARAKVIYDPFDTTAGPVSREQSAIMVRHATGMTGAAFMVGFVGNLTDQKRPLDFVEAAAKLKDGLEGKIGFVMLGELRDGLHEAVCELITHHQMESSIRLMGPRHPIEPWIAGVDVLLAPAVNEGMGRTLIEAALTGTPVVASDDGGHREIIEDGETGCLVPPNDPSSMADCAAVLLADDGRRGNIAKRAMENARSRFSTDRHVQAVIGVYARLRS